MRFIQHKQEAYWFYRFVSPVYDRWVNPLFWTPSMRAAALALARLEPGLQTLDVGAGTGFSTEGVVEHVEPGRVTMVDQSPDQLSRARRKPALAACRKMLGDAERLPFETNAFDRYVSCGSIEYWPDPQRAVADAYRVLRPGGLALIAGPLPPGGRLARRLADAWMLFPTEAEYRGWFERAGFEAIETVGLPAPWDRAGTAPYALAIAGRKSAPGGSPAAVSPAREERERCLAVRLARFLAGSAAAAAFVPVGVMLNLRARLARRGGRA